MKHPSYVLAIDQGTTSTRAILFDSHARAVALARRELEQHYPASGWVEHDAEDIWRDTLAAAREVIERTAGGVAGIAALGITNQRETAVIWERASGKPIHRAIVWQDRRTADACAALKAAGAEPLVRQKTGLLLDPYFSATKVAWLLDHVAGARERAERGELAFGSTGCFLLLNTGEAAVPSGNRMLTTPAYRIGGRITYAMEGSIFVAGAAIKWLRDGLKVIRDAAETAAAAARVPDDHGVYLVPAFVGLGAPHWEPNARGLICGLTLDASGDHLARAALESVAFQTLDLTEAMRRDGAHRAEAIRVDGGMAANDWLCQFLADVLEARVERPKELETTALGAAFLAGLATGVWSDLAGLARTYSTAAVFVPKMTAACRATLIAGWRDAVSRTLHAPPAPDL